MPVPNPPVLGTATRPVRPSTSKDQSLPVRYLQKGLLYSTVRFGISVDKAALAIYSLNHIGNCGDAN